MNDDVNGTRACAYDVCIAHEAGAAVGQTNAIGVCFLEGADIRGCSDLEIGHFEPELASISCAGGNRAVLALRLDDAVQNLARFCVVGSRLPPTRLLCSERVAASRELRSRARTCARVLPSPGWG